MCQVTVTPMFRELNQALDFSSRITLCALQNEVIFRIKCNRSPLPFPFISVYKYLKSLISIVWIQCYLTVTLKKKKKEKEFALLCGIQC